MVFLCSVFYNNNNNKSSYILIDIIVAAAKVKPILAPPLKKQLQVSKYYVKNGILMLILLFRVGLFCPLSKSISTSLFGSSNL